ncbi:hypothetical protein Ndes2526B_g05524 [Nannochloris sp. 'desiccata']|nr:putative SUN domain-containing protein 3 [Chlorella desiccata (nom. nud.)]
MCNRSATLLQQPPTPNEPVPKDDVESVKAIEEAVLEVLPTAQQNFALTRDGAKVLASNPGAKKVGAILDDDTDTYMRNECQDDKWVVLELSQVAKISRIELIQHELYSSRIKDFEIRGRQSHPRTDNVETSKGLNSTSWKLLGKFTAEKAKGTQQFNVERPIWAHYLLIRFLTHYGNEPVCALNAFAVYGKSAAEELEDQLGEGELGLEIQSGSGSGAEQEGDSVGGRSIPLVGASPPSADAEVGKKSILDSNNRAVGGIHTKEDPQLQQQKANEAVNGENAAAKIEVATSVESKEQPLGKKDAALASADKLGETTSGIQNTDASTQASFKEKSQQPSDARNSKDNSTAPTGTVDSTIGADGSSTESPSTHLENRSKPPAINITNTTLQAPPPSVKHIAATTAAVPAGGAASNGGAGGTNKLSGGGSGGGGRSLPFDVFEPLPVPKTKTGGGVYDVLVQEIRVTKAQQRVTAKALEALQRNLTAASIALSRMKTEYEVSELDLEKKVDSMISEKLNHYETEMIGLRKALKRAAKREHAALSLLAMLGGALVLSMQGSSLGENWPKARTTVLLLALANGAVGVALQWT